jgi:hypothetical protein
MKTFKRHDKGRKYLDISAQCVLVGDKIYTEEELWNYSKQVNVTGSQEMWKINVLSNVEMSLVAKRFFSMRLVV